MKRDSNPLRPLGHSVERGLGRIELPSHAPKACILPLYYSPIKYL